MASQQQASVAAILRSHPPQKWDTSDVKRWLESIGMDVYSPIFEATGVQGSDLIQMDAEALKRRCGVSSLGHRTQIMSQIAILSARATMSMKREGEKSAVSKRKELLENLYPDKARRNIKAAMDEKLLEAREMYWTPDDRKERGANEQNNAEKMRGRPTSAQRQRPGNDMFVTEGMAPVESRREAAGIHRPPVNTIPSKRRVAAPSARRASPTGEGRRRERESQDFVEVDGDEEELLSPSEHMARISERIKHLEESGNLDLDELVRAWVEYGACVRMEHGEKHIQLVRTHFYLATTYLRQKLVTQALQHFKTADSINTQIGSANNPDGQSFHCRILEGMGICETRLGHFAAAQGLLDRAMKMCVVEGGADNDGDVSGEITDSRAASVHVALSELHSAQGKYAEAVDCLIEAWQCKENELGEQHPQVGQLFNAMGTVKQKHLKELEQLLADVRVILESSIRVKQQIDDKTEGIHLQGVHEEKGVQELIQDIANYRQKQRELQNQVHACKADALDYHNRARKIMLNAKGAQHQDTVALTKTVSVLASRFAEEEREAIKAKSEADGKGKNPQSPAERQKAEAATREWLKKQGENLEEWGLASGSKANQNEIDYLISMLRFEAPVVDDGAADPAVD